MGECDLGVTASKRTGGNLGKLTNLRIKIIVSTFSSGWFAIPFTSLFLLAHILVLVCCSCSCVASLLV